MTNSDKIKKILDGGNIVNISEKHIGYSIISYCEQLGKFETSIGLLKTKYLDESSMIIKPIYKIPNFKIGDLVDVDPNYNTHWNDKKWEIIDINKDSFLADLKQKDKEWSNVPFLVMSYHIKEIEKDKKEKIEKIAKIEHYTDVKNYNNRLVIKLNEVIDRLNTFNI